MLKYLDDTRLGTFPTAAFTRAETIKRSYSVELSKFKDFELAHKGGINDLSIDPVDSRYLLSGGSDGSIVIHDLENQSGLPSFTCKIVSQVKRRSKYAHKFSVEAIQWYPVDTGMFISSSMDKTLKIWDTNRMKPADAIHLGCNIFCHQMSPVATKHHLVAVATSKEHVQLIDLKTGCNTHELRGHKGILYAVEWSPKNEYLLASGGMDNKILLWDIRSARGKLMAFDQYNGDSGSTSSHSVNTAHSGAVNSLKFNHQGNHLVSYGTDDRIRVWDVQKGLNTMVNFGKVFNDVKKNVKIDVSSGSCNELVYVPSESDIIVYEMHSGMRVNTLLGHFNSANCCTCNPDNQELYSGGNDRNILFWTPDTQQEAVYDEYLSNSKKDSIKKVLNNVTADAWSSDDD